MIGKICHLDCNARGVLVLGIQRHLQTSRLVRLRNLAEEWGRSPLRASGLSQDAKIGILAATVNRLDADIGRLRKSMKGNHRAILMAARRGAALRLANDDIVYGVLAGIDAFLAEYESAVDLTNKLVTQVLRRAKVAAPKWPLNAALKERHIECDWLDRLKKDRNLLLHESAPWIGLRIRCVRPLGCELFVILDDRPGRPPVGFPISDYRSIHDGFRRAMVPLRDWVIDKLEHGA